MACDKTHASQFGLDPCSSPQLSLLKYLHHKRKDCKLKVAEIETTNIEEEIEGIFWLVG